MFSGSKLRFNRLRAGKTQEGLARELGITSAYLSNLENGKRTPSPKIMEELARALSVPLEELFEDGGALPPIPISAAEKGILIETGEGVGKTRYILPPTPESYDLVSKHIMGWKEAIDIRLKDIVELWEKSSEEERERIMSLLFDRSQKATSNLTK
jgi:transcriptional regulator with XRE-family HTH domain